MRTKAKDICLPLHHLLLIFFSYAVIVTKRLLEMFRVSFLLLHEMIGSLQQNCKESACLPLWTTPLCNLEWSDLLIQSLWSLEGPKDVLQPHLGTWELTFTLCSRSWILLNTEKAFLHLYQTFCYLLTTLFVNYFSIFVNYFKKDSLPQRVSLRLHD